jgi:hypothetical protein
MNWREIRFTFPRVAMGVAQWFMLSVLSSAPAVIAGEVGAPRLVWNAATLRLVQPEGDYARMIRLENGGWLIGYSWQSKLWVRASADAGSTWGEPVPVAAPDGSLLTNAELLALSDGTVMALFNDRPKAALPRRNQPPPVAGLTKPFRILAAYSKDRGRTWSAPSILYTGGCEFGNGCWEPAALQLPTGEVQVYFANEAPYRESDEQEITRLRSPDQGITWSAPETVSFRPRHRDGMPKPLRLQNGRGIVVAIEDNGFDGDRFKPVIIAVELAGHGNAGPIEADSPRRWGACVPPVARESYAGAPFLAQLPSGETLLSYQESRTGDLAGARMVVRVGDREARNFGAPTQPFPGASRKTQLWNSLFAPDARTVIAISTATVEGKRGIWTVTGEITPAR